MVIADHIKIYISLTGETSFEDVLREIFYDLSKTASFIA
jgi:hypothetical protein